MKSIKGFIKGHPVLSYFALVFAISWGGGLIVVGPGAFLGTKETSGMLFLLVVLVALAGPSVAGILLTGLVDGRAGLSEFRSRLLKWRVGVRWYAVALLTAPLLYVAVLLALSLISPKFLPGIFTTSDKASLLLIGIVVGLVVGFFEELGWTGFAIPRMRQRYGILSTGLILGLLWGVWHYPLFSASGTPSVALALAIVLVRLFTWLPAYRVLMVWVYDRTGSLLVAMLMHASLSASMFILAPLVTGVAIVTSVLVWAAVLWVVVGAVALAQGGHLSRQPPLRGRVA
jgi:membrane protease YdiL (CAAX protease family)